VPITTFHSVNIIDTRGIAVTSRELDDPAMIYWRVGKAGAAERRRIILSAVAALPDCGTVAAAGRRLYILSPLVP
jgi:hypothetical protein